MHYYFWMTSKPEVSPNRGTACRESRLMGSAGKTFRIRRIRADIKPHFRLALPGKADQESWPSKDPQTILRGSIKTLLFEVRAREFIN